MKLYIGANPDTWIGEHDGVLYEFPAEFAGWQRKKVWLGKRETLKECPAYNAISTGWQGAKGCDAAKN
jgi:hypothetical protein